jgi:hypothetical protein
MLGAFRMRLLLVCAALLSDSAVGAAENALMFPVPKGAEKAAHVVLVPGVAEQDYFWITAEYPATPALEHYSKLFSGWKQCGDPSKGWDGYGDMSHGNNRYLHNFVRHWVSPANDRVVTVLFQYQSKGIESRRMPDNKNQFVAVIQHRAPDASAHLASIDVKCPKAPNTTVETDARKSGARGSP